jgi:hypothetical protein
MSSFLPAEITICWVNWRRDRPVVLREGRSLQVAQQQLQLGVLAQRRLGEDRLLAEVVDLLLQLLVVGLRVDQPVEPAGRVAERPGDSLGAHLEGAQDARARALGAVQEAAVGLAEVHRDERQRDDREHGDDRPSADDRARASGLRGRAGTLGMSTDRRHARCPLAGHRTA